jgi:hypothetical protein
MTTKALVKLCHTPEVMARADLMFAGILTVRNENPNPWRANAPCVCGHVRMYHRKGLKCRAYACTCGEFKLQDTT